ncbi:MAG: hypothetical protein ACTTKL_08535 [Treponema sp.]
MERMIFFQSTWTEKVRFNRPRSFGIREKTTAQASAQYDGKSVFAFEGCSDCRFPLESRNAFG